MAPRTEQYLDRLAHRNSQIIMQTLRRHFNVTEIYASACAAATREALKRLVARLDG